MKKENIEKRVVTIIQDFLKESGTGRAFRAVTPEARLEQDLGVGSLEKAELMGRLEKAFSIHLPDMVIAQARTVDDLVLATIQAHPLYPQTERDYAQSKVGKGEHDGDIDLSRCKTLVDVLLAYVHSSPDRPHLYVQDVSGKECLITYGKLYEQARTLAKGFQSLGLRQHETVAVMLPTSEEFFYVYFGILLAGAVPVPIYPPHRMDLIEEYIRRETKVLINADIRILVTFHEAEGLSKLLRTFIPNLKQVVTAETLFARGKVEDFKQVTVRETSPALIQYTSGSTGGAKGVLLTHFNLLSNIIASGEGARLRSTDRVVSWLPLYHDMGLIGAWLGSLVHGMPVNILSPISFLLHPARWLWAIHYHRASVSAAPNFAYDLCTRKISEHEIVGLDLSCWRLALNGAEAVHAETLRRFVKKFRPYGFKEEAFFPAYGLAEASVALTFPPPGRKPRIDRVLRDVLERDHRAIPANESDTDILEFVSCGKPLSRHEVRIVDDDNRIVEERVIGCLQFRGPSTMQGYFRNPDETKRIYHDGWWDSGDFAYIADGETYITGRKKDMIIKAGRNLYPDTIEESCAEIPGIKKGGVLAFGVSSENEGTEKLVVVAETSESNREERKRIRAAIVENVSSNVGVPPDEVVLVPARTIPKTSSGKLQRSACRQMYVKHQLSRRPLPAWVQISQLYWKGWRRNILHTLSVVARSFYASYIAALMLLSLPLLWLAISISSRRQAYVILRHYARLLLLFVFLPVRMKGRDRWEGAEPGVVVANHASYLDSLVLLATLPFDAIYVGKKELRKVPLLRTVFDKLDFLTVDRFDFAKNLADTEMISQKLREGRMIVMFPEGTFTEAEGLRPFKSGAFKVAVDGQRPVYPVALAGTRRILRGDFLIPHWGKIKVTFCKPLNPEGGGWREVSRLRDESHSVIARHCGERTLELI